jgi:hypothetical protein
MSSTQANHGVNQLLEHSRTGGMTTVVELAISPLWAQELSLASIRDSKDTQIDKPGIFLHNASLGFFPLLPCFPN